MSDTLKCRICDAEFSRNLTGRPKRYCSGACKRVAELRIRRLNERIGVWEGKASEARVDRTGLRDMGGLDASERAEVYEQEVARLELQLRELIEDGSQAE